MWRRRHESPAERITGRPRLRRSQERVSGRRLIRGGLMGGPYRLFRGLRRRPVMGGRGGGHIIIRGGSVVLEEVWICIFIAVEAGAEAETCRSRAEVEGAARHHAGRL